MAKRHDGEMRQIAEQAHALVHTHLCDAARRCYLYELLRRYMVTMSSTLALTRTRTLAFTLTLPQMSASTDPCRLQTYVRMHTYIVRMCIPL